MTGPPGEVGGRLAVAEVDPNPPTDPHPFEATSKGLEKKVTRGRGYAERDALLYELGASAGYDVGWAHGWAACDDKLHALLGVYRVAFRSPRQAELEAARTPSDEPCARRCRRCSRCIRFAAAFRNRQRYGSPDFPGGAA